MARSAARRHLWREGASAQLAPRRSQVALEDRRPGTRLVVADRGQGSDFHHGRHRGRSGALRLRSPGQVAVADEERPGLDGRVSRGQSLLRVLRRPPLSHERPWARGLLGGRLGQGALERRRTGAFPGTQYPVGHERVPAGRWAAADCHPRRQKGLHGRFGQVVRSNGLDRGTVRRGADELLIAALFRYAGRRLLANSCSTHGIGVDADTGSGSGPCRSATRMA